ncbi:MAG: YggT family protein [Treponema sp.]
MQYVNLIFKILASLLTIYSFLCSIRIILTWIPGLSNGFTNFLSRICDPYLNLFSRLGIFRFGAIDFSPVISLGILALLSTISSSLAHAGTITLGFILALILQMAWNVVSSIIGFLLIVLIIRFVVLLFQNNSYNGSQFWKQFDYVLNPVIYKIIAPFSKGRMVPYKTALLISIISLFVVRFAGSLFIYQLARLLRMIPF